MCDKKYVIYKNDLKNKNISNINFNNVDWEQNDIKNLIKTNFDTLEYRLNENEKNMLDLNNIKLSIIPESIKNNLYYNNLLHLFISNNNLKNDIDFSNFKVLETLDIDNNFINNIILPKSLKELSANNNKLIKLECNKNLLRLRCTNNLLETINLSNIIELLEINNNKIKYLDLSNFKNIDRLIIHDNPLIKLVLTPKLLYIDLSNTQIDELIYNKNNILDYKINHLVCNNCTNLTNIPQFKYIEFLEIIGSPVEKLYFYKDFKLIILQINLTKNISKKYKDNNANINIRNNILLTISSNEFIVN